MTVTRIRGLTVAGGIALGGLILLATGVLGVIERDDGGPAPDAGATGGRAGPLTGVQPALEQALLTGGDLPPTRAAGEWPAGGSPAPGSASPAAAVPAPSPEPGRDDQPPAGAGGCRALFEDASGLAAMWPTTVPHELSARDTTGDGGSVLRQVLGVFDEDAAEAAYLHLRETVAGCEEFTALLAGEPVQVLVADLSGDRREAGYAADVTVLREGGRLVGWLAVDRIGPVVSVLRHLRPEETLAASTPAETRRTALHKLRPLLRFLDRGGHGAR